MCSGSLSKLFTVNNTILYDKPLQRLFAILDHIRFIIQAMQAALLCGLQVSGFGTRKPCYY